jgi:hypothetical protein
METFAKLFGSLLTLVYDCFDRIVILGHGALRLLPPEKQGSAVVSESGTPPSTLPGANGTPTSSALSGRLTLATPHQCQRARSKSSARRRIFLYRIRTNSISITLATQRQLRHTGSNRAR